MVDVGWRSTSCWSFSGRGEPEQHLSKSCRELEQGYFGDVLVSLSQTLAKDLDEAQQCPGLPMQKLQDTGTIKHCQFAISDGLGIGGSLFTVKNGDLAEEFTGVHDCQQ